MPAITFDTSLFPLVVSRFPSTWSEEDLTAYFASFVALHAREKPFLHLSDISRAENMSKAGMRKKAADFMSVERSRSERLCKGAVQVAQSGLVRGAITAIQWVTPPPYPHAVVASWPEAIAWIVKQAALADLTLPPAAMRLST